MRRAWERRWSLTEYTFGSRDSWRARDQTGRIQDMHISLYHCHLPKLGQHGIVDHNRETGEVVLSDDGEALKTAVGAAEETLRPLMRPLRTSANRLVSR
ncbi:DUF7344 domain-containing protein [Halomarina pelagica]|uniref:DUF7344 domain-containing protein n=1 Tax=Halomarina pelagica TaxID=2961599 RepID=UPI003F5F0403